MKLSIDFYDRLHSLEQEWRKDETGGACPHILFSTFSLCRDVLRDLEQKERNETSVPMEAPNA